MADPNPTPPVSPEVPAAPAVPVVPAAPVVAEPAKPEASPLGGKPVVPAESVKYEFKAPEGVTLDEGQTKSYTELATKLGLKPDQAQEVLDYYGKDVVKPLVEQVTKAVTEANTKAFTDLTTTWKAEIDKDPDLSGANREPAQAIIGKALDTYFSKEAREAFDMTGAGWNPHIVKGILKMAQALSEGQPTNQGGPVVERKATTLGEKFYPPAAN